MNRIIIKQNGNDTVIYAENGEKLSDVLIKNGFYTDHPCAGKGMCKKCTVDVNGKQELSCRYVINSDVSVVLQDKNEIETKIHLSDYADVSGDFCFAFDIGTTTLALALVSVEEKTVIKVLTCTNPQRIFGADVISRIAYCKHNGVKEMHDVIITALNRMISEFVKEYGITAKKLFVSGNTTMIHLFFGIDCSSMGVSPYLPRFLESKSVNADELGIKNVREVVSLPNISAFIGSDIVAGLNYAGIPDEGKYNFLVDLGTNAEVVLYSRDRIVCTAAAAGPCFECSNIECGMSAADGAVSAFVYGNPPATIGNKKPVGICATGLIDVIAEFVKNGVIDKNGYMESDKYEIAENVFLSQNDVRNFQLAKSAVYSAIITLMKAECVSFRDIDRFFVAGGFSTSLDIANAVSAGLLPLEFFSRYKTVGNSSLEGTVKYILENNKLNVCVENAEYIDLAGDSVFSDLFVKNMMFEFYD